MTPTPRRAPPSTTPVLGSDELSREWAYTAMSRQREIALMTVTEGRFTYRTRARTSTGTSPTTATRKDAKRWYGLPGYTECQRPRSARQQLVGQRGLGHEQAFHGLN